MAQEGPGSGFGDPEGVGPGGGGEFPSYEEYPKPADLYTVNDYYVPLVTPRPSITATPGTTVYFCVLAAGPNKINHVQTDVLPDEADLVAIQISGVTKNGERFEMAGDRATIMAEDVCGKADGYSPSAYYAPYALMPFFGVFAQAFRMVPWKVPPFMPEGSYKVWMLAYQHVTSFRYFTDGRRAVALGHIVVNANGGSTAGMSLRFGSGTPPSSSNPVFGLRWTASDFDNNPATLRTTLYRMEGNVKRYYCISPGSSVLSYISNRTTCAGLPTAWDANMPVPNSGSESVRYNSTALFGGPVGGQYPASIPAGYQYHAYLDVVDDSATPIANTQYMSTELNGVAPIVLP